MAITFNPLSGQFENTQAVKAELFVTTKAKGNITTLAQALVDPATNAGAWYVSTVAGDLSGTNSGSITVAIGDFVLSNGTAFLVVSPQSMLAPNALSEIEVLGYGKQSAAIDNLLAGRKPLDLMRFKRKAGEILNARGGALPAGQFASLMVYGDSTGETYSPTSQVLELFGVLGFRGVFAGGGPSFAIAGYGTGTAGGVSSGTIVHGRSSDPNYSYSLNGGYFELQGSGNLVGFFNSAGEFDQATFLYGTAVGGGTFAIQTLLPNQTSEYVDDGGWATVATIDTGGAANGLATHKVTLAKGSQVRALWVSGSSAVVGALLEDSTANGLIFSDWAVGGLYGGDTNSMPVANMRVILNLLQPDLITYQQKDEAPADLAPVLSAFSVLIKSARPLTPILWISTYESGNSPEGTSKEYAIVYEAQAAANAEDELWDTSIDLPSIQYQFDNGLNRNFKTPAYVVSSITRSGSTATLTTSVAHGLLVGSRIEVAQALQPEYNVKYVPVVAVPTTTTLTFAVSGSPTTPALPSGAFELYTIDGTHLRSTEKIVASFRMASGLWDMAGTKVGKDVENQEVSTKKLLVSGVNMAERDSEVFGAALEHRSGIVCAAGTAQGVRIDRSAEIGTSDFTVCGFFKVSANGGLALIRLRSLGSLGGNANGEMTLGTSGGGAVLSVTGLTPAWDSSIWSCRPADDIYQATFGKVIFVALRRRQTPPAGESILSLCINGKTFGVNFDPTTTSDGAYSVLGRTITFGFPSSALGPTVNVYSGAAYLSGLTDAQLASIAATGVYPSGANVLLPLTEGYGNTPREYANGWPCLSNGPIVWNAPRLPAIDIQASNISTTPARSGGKVVPTHANSTLNQILLPEFPQLGDTIQVVGRASGGWRLIQYAGHKILEGAGATVGTNATTTGATGHLSSSQRYDSVELTCVTSDEVTPSYLWIVTRKNGTLDWV